VFFTSLRSRLIVVLALALLPAAALAIVESVRTYERATVLADRSLVSDAVLAAAKEQSILIEARRTIQTLALLPDILLKDEESCTETLRGIHTDGLNYFQLTIVRRDGMLVCSMPGADTERTLEDSPFLAAMNANPRFMVTRQLVESETGERLVALLAPIFDKDGKHVGQVAALLRVDRLESLLNADGSLQASFVAMLNGNGDVLAVKKVENVESGAIPDTAMLRRQMSADITFFTSTDPDRRTLNYALAPLVDNDVFLLIGTTRNHWHSGFAWRLAIAILAPLAMYAVALGVAWYAVDRLVLRHIDQLRRVVDLVERGRGSTRARLPANTPGEIEVLADNMNDMLDAIDNRETALELALNEQKLLTKEVFHRVKNNLQIVSSLMSLQVRSAESDDSRRAILTARKRIQALSTVHEHLYRDDGIASVPLDTLVREITRTVQDGFDDTIPAIFDIEPIVTDPDRAIPLALLITEAVANAFEYAGGSGSAVPVKISIGQDGPGNLKLVVANPTRTDKPVVLNDGLGMNLIRVLARQLRGTLNITQGELFRVELVFPGVVVKG
jgi:two-component sensor histidine kinase